MRNLINCTEIGFGRGQIFRVPMHHSDEPYIDLIHVDLRSKYGVIVFTGYNAGKFIALLPPESELKEERGTNVRWLIDNWQTRIYPACPVENVLTYRLTPAENSDNYLMNVSKEHAKTMLTQLTVLQQKLIRPGGVLRFPAKYPFEKCVDFMLLDDMLEYKNFSLMASSGHYCGMIEQILPIESRGWDQKGDGIDVQWLIRNWEEWIYPECSVERVYYQERYMPALGRVYALH